MAGVKRSDLTVLAAGVLLCATGAAELRAQHEGRAIKSLAPFEVDYFEAAHTIRLAGDADRVFQMFTPEGRRTWSSFDPLLLYKPEEGWQGAVYLQATIHEEPNTAIVADFEPQNRRIRYLTVIPRSEAWEMDITVEPDGEASKATVTYRVTPLSPEANDEVREFFDSHFEPAVRRWKEAIDRVLGGSQGSG